VNFRTKMMRITCIEPMPSSAATTTKPTPTARRRTTRTITRSIVSSGDCRYRRYRGVDATTPLITRRRRTTRCNDVGVVVIPFASSASGSFEAMPPERHGGDDNDVGGGGFFSKCILWLQKQVQNARNAAPLLKWPDAVLLSKQTARDVTRNAVVILIGLCVFTAMLGCIDWCIVAFRAWLLK
jgi:hypothetical protein